MSYDLSNYVDVPTRLKMALEKYPDLRIQELPSEMIELASGTFIKCTVKVWRDATDPVPTIASACEIVPGRTPYTKDSENEVGHTSALGRALGYMGFGISKSIASKNEVEAAKSRENTTPKHYAPTTQAVPSVKQLTYLRALGKGQELEGDKLRDYCASIIGRELKSAGDLTAVEISKVIDALKALSQQTAEEPY